jgi:DNA-binding response OmpR family regulator
MMEERMEDIVKRKILVVDDEINVCKSIRQAITKEEYEVDMALSGEEALQMDKEKLYDLVITDLMMPGISGVELLTSLKINRPEVIVILVTGYPTIKTAVQSVKLGAFDYIPKPFTPDELRSLVSRAFRKAAGKEVETEKAPSPVLPEGLYLMRGHTWLRKEEEHMATVGVVYDFFKNLETITRIELTPENKTIIQGEVCARITDAEGHTHRIWSPASGRIARINKTIEEDINLLKKDPYGRGWLLQIVAPELEKDIEGLVAS